MSVSERCCFHFPSQQQWTSRSRNYWQFLQSETIKRWSSLHLKEVHIFKVLTRHKTPADSVENPKRLETLTDVLLGCFSLQINSREFSKAVQEWKEEGGKERLTFNLLFSCYVHLGSHREPPPRCTGRSSHSAELLTSIVLHLHRCGEPRRTSKTESLWLWWLIITFLREGGRSENMSHCLSRDNMVSFIYF